jgi:apolipoprotein D and lipocalin family protein
MHHTKLIIPISLGVLGFLLFNSCTPKIPKGAVALSNFDSEKYLGKWYEIARLDFRFEKDLNNVTADYSKKANGAIKVLNRGFNSKKNKWVEAEGEAKPVGDKEVAKLKVSFFKPFWSGYNVIDIEDYTYALVAGDSLDYLWILSREKTIPDEIKERFLNKATGIGYDIQKLVWVEHD